MLHQEIQKSSSWNSSSEANRSRFAPRPLIVQAQEESRRAPTQQETENEAFDRNVASRFGHNFADISVHAPDGPVSAPVQPQVAPIQAKSTVGQSSNKIEQQPDRVARPAAEMPASVEQRSNQTGLPDALKSGIEQLAGLSLDDVRVNYNSTKPAQLDALAYAQGRDIHVAPGQERHLPHETWHVVQQAQGRVKPTMQMMDGIPVNDDQGLEHEADVMGAKTVQPKGGMRDSSDQQNQAVQTNENAGDIHTAKVVQLVKQNGWTKAKAARYREHLIRRGTRRGMKNKPVAKLVRKAVKARKLADPHFKGLRLADAPSAGHHVPALAMANKRSGTMPYGKRGSSTEKKRQRPYFRGTQDERENAHGIVHEAETFVGLGSRNAAAYSGTDEELARLHRLSGAGLTLDDGISPIRVDVQTQADKEARKRSRYDDMPIEEAKETIFEEEHGIKKPKTEEWLEDSTDSEPESDEENWISDSDDE